MNRIFGDEEGKKRLVLLHSAWRHFDRPGHPEMLNLSNPRLLLQLGGESILLSAFDGDKKFFYIHDKGKGDVKLVCEPLPEFFNQTCTRVFEWKEPRQNMSAMFFMIQSGMEWLPKRCRQCGQTDSELIVQNMSPWEKDDLCIYCAKTKKWNENYGEKTI